MIGWLIDQTEQNNLFFGKIIAHQIQHKLIFHYTKQGIENCKIFPLKCHILKNKMTTGYFLGSGHY